MFSYVFFSNTFRVFVGRVVKPFIWGDPMFSLFLPLMRPTILEAVIKLAAGAASLGGDYACSRLLHSLKSYVFQGGCASSQLIQGFSDSEVRMALYV